MKRFARGLVLKQKTTRNGLFQEMFKVNTLIISYLFIMSITPSPLPQQNHHSLPFLPQRFLCAVRTERLNTEYTHSTLFSLMASTADSSETLKSLVLQPEQSLFSLINVLCNFLSKVLEFLPLTLSHTAIVFLISFVIVVPFHEDHLRVSWSFDLVIITLV